MPTSRFKSSLFSNKDKKYEVFSGRNKFYPLGIGGNEIIESNYFRYHFFTTTGSTSFIPDSDLTNVDVCAIGGGGGGGFDIAGGGGAGDITLFQRINISNQTYTVVVGDKGVGSNTSDVKGDNGQNSIFKTSSEELLVALGGGGAGSSPNQLSGNTGGSGGGSTPSSTSPNVSGGSSSGFNVNAGGGTDRASAPGLYILVAAGGGGGATSAGSAGTVGISPDFANGGNAGQGFLLNDIDEIFSSLSIFSGMTRLGSGGGGAGSVLVGAGTSSSGSGGDGGGVGANDNNSTTTAATHASSFGSGGGGGGWSARANSAGKDGYQGLVIIRYPIKIYEYVI
jgi:hypothetical protein